MTKASDRWRRWLTDVRFGGDPELREQILSYVLHPVRDTVALVFLLSRLSAALRDRPLVTSPEAVRLRVDAERGRRLPGARADLGENLGSYLTEDFAYSLTVHGPSST